MSSKAPVALAWVNQTTFTRPRWEVNPTCLFRSKIPSSGSVAIRIVSSNGEEVPPAERLRAAFCGSSEGVRVETPDRKQIVLYISAQVLLPRSLALRQVPQLTEEVQPVIFSRREFDDCQIRIDDTAGEFKSFQDWIRVIETEATLCLHPETAHGMKTFADISLIPLLWTIGGELHKRAKFYFVELITKSIAICLGGERPEIARQRQHDLLVGCIAYISCVVGKSITDEERELVCSSLKDGISELIWCIYLYYRTHYMEAHDYCEAVLQLLDFLLAIGPMGKDTFARICTLEMPRGGSYYLAFNRPKLPSGRTVILFDPPHNFYVLKQSIPRPIFLAHVPKEGYSEKWKSCSHAPIDKNLTINFFA